jgi:hypothetical protein
LDGFDKKVIGVSFALVGSRRFPDVHWPLHIAFYHGNVKRNCGHFSHYYDWLTQARFENKPLLQNDPGFLQESTPTAGRVEMWRGGLGAAYLLPALSSAGASLAVPCFRFHIPLIEPDVPVSGIRLSEKDSRLRPRKALRPLNKPS